jgi:[amino group carrier protein]-L-2-aminoadipate/L-glutamate 6-kinase
MKIVLKIGGSLLKGGVPGPLVRDVALLSGRHSLILVHGGGDVVTDLATRLGKEQRFLVSPGGIRSRYTDRETAEIYTMAMTGKVAKNLVLALREAGVRAVSVSGLDGSLILGRRKKKLVVVDERGRKMLVEGGYTGKVESVDATLIDALRSTGYMPVVSPVAVGEGSIPLNIDGDRAASAIAVATDADALAFATDVDGLMMEGKLVEALSSEEAKKLLPRVGFGMQKKVMASVEALEGGVREALIFSGRSDAPLSRAVEHARCTVIS